MPSPLSGTVVSGRSSTSSASSWTWNGSIFATYSASSRAKPSEIARELFYDSNVYDPDCLRPSGCVSTFRWRKMLETGVHATVDDIAVAEHIDATYVSRILRLTLLAPDIVEAALDGAIHIGSN